MRIANSYVFKEPVYNYTAYFPFLWDETKIPIQYGCNVGQSRELLQRVATEVASGAASRAKEAWHELANRYLLDDEGTDPVVTLAANDNWMEFTIRYVVDYRSRRSTKDRLFTRILEEIDASSGRVAIASTTLQLVDIPVVDIRHDGERQSPGSESTV